MKLLPCPFCGYAPEVIMKPFVNKTKWYSIRCSAALTGDKTCQIQPRTNGVLSYEAAAKTWNTRKLDIIS